MQKHKDLIIAWANGATIECKDSYRGHWHTITTKPEWLENVEYRVKPQVVSIKAVSETYGCDGCVFTDSPGCTSLVDGMETLGLPKCGEGYIYVKV